MDELLEMPVLLVDVQATGANPAKGASPIDVAWCVTRASAPECVADGSLVALPKGAYLPRRVQSITGISKADLVGAPSHDEVVERVADAWTEVAEAGVVVAHYARYERPFVAGWLGDEPASRMVCTHEIIKRLMPNLPRRGLRPIAGYFGARLSEHKRASVHVEATAVIWREIAQILCEEEGVTTLEGLRDWLATRSGKRTGKRDFPLPRETRLGLPECPGVYRMLNRRGEVMYVGKATSLKSRVNSYYRGKHGQGERKLELVSAVVELDVTELATPLEAALLEVDEIKRHEPFYNVALREKDREIWFADPEDLLDVAQEPGERRSLGPLGSPIMIQCLGTLQLALDDPEIVLDPEWFHGLDLDVHDDPMPEGLALFAQWHGFEDGATTDELFALGLELYARYLEERARRRAEKAALAEAAALAEDDEDDEDDAEPVERPEFVWTPPHVARKLGRIVRRAAQRVRRGELMLALADGELVWTPTRGEAGVPRLVRLEGGAVVEQGLAPDDYAPGARQARSRHDALSTFDVATYDRVSVLVAELKRLVREGNPIVLTLPGMAPLDREGVAALLAWV